MCLDSYGIHLENGNSKDEKKEESDTRIKTKEH